MPVQAITFNPANNALIHPTAADLAAANPALAGASGTGALHLVADQTARFALTGTDAAYGATALQEDTLNVWLLLDAAHPSSPSSWVNLGCPAGVLIYSETNGAYVGNPIPTFTAAFSGYGGLLYATSDNRWSPTPVVVDGSGIMQVAAINVGAMVALTLPSAPLQGLLTIGDPTQSAGDPVAPGLQTLNVSGTSISTLNLWNLTQLNSVNASGCASLSAIALNAPVPLGALSASGCAFSQASVDAILAALGGIVTHGTADLSGGSSSGPSSSVDVDRLLTEGWTVATN